ncbi:MAG: hypothetical protein H7312_00795 [Tardiphaga sp.]|nr:hypothetical protein [Tardiphaga sp.]
MKNYTPWDGQQIDKLKELIAARVSLARAAVIMKRPQASVQAQARKLGMPFPGVRAIRAAIKAKMADSGVSGHQNRGA